MLPYCSPGDDEVQQVGSQEQNTVLKSLAVLPPSTNSGAGRNAQCLQNGTDHSPIIAVLGTGVTD